MEQFGQIICNQHEELWISLKEVGRRWLVELRVRGRAQNGLGESQSRESIITLPIDQLPLLLNRLERVRESCVKRGQLGGASVGEMVVMDRGEEVVLRDPNRMGGHRGRQHPRVPVRYAVLCQPLPTALSPQPLVLRGEFRDLSVGGAQLLLPCRLELGQQVEVAGSIEGQSFRARAEVVGAELRLGRDANGRGLRHHLKWLTYNAAAADILTNTLLRATGDSPAHPDTASESGPSREQLREGTQGGRTSTPSSRASHASTSTVSRGTSPR